LNVNEGLQRGENIGRPPREGKEEGKEKRGSRRTGFYIRTESDPGKVPGLKEKKKSWTKDYVNGDWWGH